jgi:hypothetical protein
MESTMTDQGQWQIAGNAAETYERALLLLFSHLGRRWWLHSLTRGQVSAYWM